MSSEGKKVSKRSRRKQQKHEALVKAIEQLTPAQQTQLRRAALSYSLEYGGGKKRRGRKELPRELLERRQADQERLYEEAGDAETVRMLPRWEVQDLVPGRTLRQGADKQQLRQREEAELPLDRFGQGLVQSPRPVFGTLFDGGRRDFAWGIYARAADAEQALGAAWAGRDPEAAVQGSALYRDILRHGRAMELTLMALTTRPLPLGETREQLAAKLERSAQRLSGRAELAPALKSDLSKFVRSFDDEVIAKADLVDAKGNVKEGTHFLFTATKTGGLVAEAITPGPLGNRRQHRLVAVRSPLVATSLFDMFLGPESIDEGGKQAVGQGMLWAANGFRFRPWELAEGSCITNESDPQGRPAFPRPEPEAVERLPLPLRPSVFQLLDEQTRALGRMLLGGVSRAQPSPAT